MKQDRFRQIDALFDEVLDAPTLEREKILDEKCGKDEELKNKVLSLFSALKNSDDFIENSEFRSVKTFIENDADDFIGKKIGAYRLKKLIGRGGMSAVYLASRIDDYEKEVAVKIIPPFEKNKQSSENFRRERQILARLSHPNIAQILDGGATDSDTPYIVMEYVDGLPLDEFCAAKNLSEKEKIELLKVVCGAVTFAHHNLIVHRDLKPHNILVCDDGAPKLLDFGIAKLLDNGGLYFAENKTFDGNALTLEYASPEQIKGENITVASDVYSLGVIFYELLTGERPHDLKHKSLGEILKTVENETTISPSEISNSSNSELDAIVLKSLAKSPDERYQSAEEFCADLDRYLRNEPIAARPVNAFYRFKKYIRRHRVEAFAASLFLLLIGGWLITSAWQYRKEKTQARENRRAAYSAEMILAANEYEHSNLNRLREIVEKYQKPENGEEDLRGFEWYFLNNLLNSPGKIKDFQHPDEIWSAKFSPDGKYIATACNDNRVRVFDLETGTSVESEEQKGAWKIAFFADSKRFAVSSSSNSATLVKIYETASAKEILTFTGHRKRVRAVAVSSDGKTVASGDQNGSLIIWNADNGAEIRRFEFDSAQKNIELQSLQFSHSGDKLAVLGFETFAVFDTKNWKRTDADKAKLLDKNVFLSGWDLEFSPLDKTIAIGTFEGDVVFFDAEKLEVIRVLKLHQANIKSLSFSPDGKVLATASWDRTVKFVDVQKGEIINELRGHFAGVHDVEFSPDGKTLATAGADFRLNLWDSEQVSNENALLTSASNFAFSPDGKTGFGWNNIAGELSRYDLETKRKIWNIKADVIALTLDYNEISNIVAIGGKDGYVSIFDAQNGAQIKHFRPHDRTIYAIRVSNDGTLIYTAHEDGVVKAVNRETEMAILSIKADSDVLKFINQSPDGKFLVTGGNSKTIKIYEANTGNEIKVLEGHNKPLYRAVFSGDGVTLITIGADDVIKVWRVSDWTLRSELSGTSAGVFAAAFSPDGKRLATASDVGIIRLWNTETGEQVLTFTANQRQIINLKFTADGTNLLSFDIAGKLQIWKSR